MLDYSRPTGSGSLKRAIEARGFRQSSSWEFGCQLQDDESFLRLKTWRATRKDTGVSRCLYTADGSNSLFSLSRYLLLHISIAKLFSSNGTTTKMQQLRQQDCLTSLWLDITQFNPKT